MRGTEVGFEVVLDELILCEYLAIGDVVMTSDLPALNKYFADWQELIPPNSIWALKHCADKADRHTCMALSASPLKARALKQISVVDGAYLAWRPKW